MKRKLIVIAVSVLTLAACGPGATETLGDPEFITVIDDMTGKTFRCLYVDGGYAANMLCYEPAEGELP